ncbi:MAG: hypothetical protein KDC65_00630 [Saprospiraceae bacterium]|nr:hypothetical protein [Saprospiraceae bacterium]
MQPFLFYAEIVEQTIREGTPMRVRLRVVPNPDFVDAGDNVVFDIRFLLDDNDLLPDGTTAAGGSNPVPQITGSGIYYYNFSGLAVQQAPYSLVITVTNSTDTDQTNLLTTPATFSFLVIPAPVVPPNQTAVSLSRYTPPDTVDEPFWDNLKASQIKFKPLYDFVISTGLCNPDANSPGSPMLNRLPFVGVGQYSILKFAVEAYMVSAISPGDDPALNNYLVTQGNFANAKVLPYYNMVLQNLQQYQFDVVDTACKQKLYDKIRNFNPLELIYDYWMDQAGLTQAMNLICLRFQNIDKVPELAALYRLDTNPLLPLSNLLWGFCQDEQHTVSQRRRGHEYGCAYGLTLIGDAVRNVRGIDNRSRFLEAYHTLLHKCAVYYVKSDDTTYIADGLPVLNALKEVHILLAEGNHNSYSNLTFTARHENIVRQFLLSQPEMDRFLGGRAMVPYAEPWQGPLDTVRGMMRWGNAGARNFYDLAYYGELILLSVRWGNWSAAIDPNQAANWADAFRNEIMQYIHSYRAVAGVDLSADTTSLSEEHFKQPSWHIMKRMVHDRNTGKQGARSSASATG